MMKFKTELLEARIEAGAMKVKAAMLRAIADALDPIGAPPRKAKRAKVSPIAPIETNNGGANIAAEDTAKYQTEAERRS